MKRIAAFMLIIMVFPWTSEYNKASVIRVEQIEINSIQVDSVVCKVQQLDSLLVELNNYNYDKSKY